MVVLQISVLNFIPEQFTGSVFSFKTTVSGLNFFSLDQLNFFYCIRFILLFIVFGSVFKI